MALIYVDACLLIYQLEGHPVFGPQMTAAMQQHRESTFAISPLVKLECLVAPMKRGDPVLQRNFEAIFRQFVSVYMPEVVYFEAAALRARFALETPDALHLAVRPTPRLRCLVDERRALGQSHTRHGAQRTPIAHAEARQTMRGTAARGTARVRRRSE